MQRAPRTSTLVPLALLVLIAMLSLGFMVVNPQGLFNRDSDLVGQHLATQSVLHESWRSSADLLWRSDQLSGFPAATNPQAAYSHPAHWFFAVRDPATVVGLVMWLQMLAAAVGGYLVAVRLGCGLAGRLMTAVGTLFSFKTMLAVYAGWLPVLESIVAMPYLVAAAAWVFERPSCSSALALIAAGTLALHVGHPQLIYYTLLFLALWMLWTLAALVARGDYGRARRILALLALAGVVAVGLSAYRLFPIAADLDLVTRTDDEAFFLAGAPYPTWGLLTVFNPEVFGTVLDGSLPSPWELVLYFGAVPLALIIVDVFFGSVRPHVRPLRWAFLLSALLAIDTPLLGVVSDVLPGYQHFRIPARILFLTAFFGFCIAGVALDDVLRKLPARSRPVLAFVLIALVAAEGTYWARRYLQTPHPISYPMSEKYLDAVRPERPSRVASLSTELLNPGMAWSAGLQLVTGYDPFILRHYQTYMDVAQFGRALGPRPTVRVELQKITRWDLLQALNVEYLLASSPLDAAASGFVLAGEYEVDPAPERLNISRAYVYRNEQFLPRAFFASQVRNVASEHAMIDEVIRSNLRDVVVVLGDQRAPSRAGEDNAEDDHVQILASSGGALDVAVRNEHARFLVLSEVWHPGWSATVDGKPTALARANIALQGLWLEPGTHHVTIRFWPTGLTAGLVVTGTTVLLLAVAGVSMVRRRRAA